MALTRLSNLNLIDLPDCVGLMEDGSCSRLDAEQCLGHACPLMRSSREEAAALTSAFTRLGSLDHQLQAKIARKYYGGKRVWADPATSGKTPNGGGV